MKPGHYTVSTIAALVALAWSIAICPQAHAENGWFLGASIGASSMDEQFDDLRLDDSSSSFRLFGGWQFNDYLAVEGGYLSFGEFEQSFTIDEVPVTVALDADGFTFAARGNWAVGDAVRVEPRVGVFFWDGNADVNGASSADPGDTNLFLGLGLSARVSDRLSLTVDWTRYRLEDDSTNVDVDVLSAGLRVALGRGKR